MSQCKSYVIKHWGTLKYTSLCLMVCGDPVTKYSLPCTQLSAIIMGCVKSYVIQHWGTLKHAILFLILWDVGNKLQKTHSILYTITHLQSSWTMQSRMQSNIGVHSTPFCFTGRGKNPVTEHYIISSTHLAIPSLCNPTLWYIEVSILFLIWAVGTQFQKTTLYTIICNHHWPC